MNRKQKMSVLLVCLMVAMGGGAADVAAQAIQEGQISKLFVHNGTQDSPDSQRVIVRLQGDVVGGLCEKKDYWQLLLSNQAERAQYELLLASYMNGKKVKIWGNPDKHCIHKGEQIRNVEIVK